MDPSNVQQSSLAPISCKTVMESAFKKVTENRGAINGVSSFLYTIERIGRELSAADCGLLDSTIGLGKTVSSFSNLTWDNEEIKGDFKAAAKGLKHKELAVSSLAVGKLLKRLNSNGISVVFALSGIAELLGFNAFSNPLIYQALILSKITSGLYQAATLHQSQQLLVEWDKAEEAGEVISLFKAKLGLTEDELAAGDGNQEALLQLKEKALEQATSPKAVALIKEAIALDSKEAALGKLEEAKQLVKEEVFSNQVSLALNLNFFAKAGLVAVFPGAAPVGALLTLGGATVALWKFGYDVGFFKQAEQVPEKAEESGT